MKKALITGVTGQDGAYLAAQLLGKGYEVTGTVMASAPDSPWRLQALGIEGKVRLEPMDLEDASSPGDILLRTRPDEIYNLAALSSAALSFERPVAAFIANGLGSLNLFEAARRTSPGVRIFQASSAEMFGAADNSPQDESTPLRPLSPYGVAKTAAHHGAAMYRNCFDLFVSCGILYNHESPLRGPEFVTGKIARAAVRLAAGGPEPLTLGNLDARRDWGWAPDYVDAMWRMLQRPRAGDYVVATGRAHSVREFASAAFDLAGLPLEWRGRERDETGVSRRDGRVLVRVDPASYRPADPVQSVGNASKALRELGWAPAVSFEELVARLIRALGAPAPVAKMRTPSPVCA
jgi:GDPmannose 4,6-dehydratase